MLRRVLYFTLLLGATSAVVHKFLAQPHRLDSETARIRQNSFEKRRLQEIREDWPEFDEQNELRPSLSVNSSLSTSLVYLANITIGTPAQTFVAKVDLWHGSDLCVISSNANLSYVWSSLPEKHTYNTSSSSSFVDLNSNFTDWVCGSGKNGSDQVTVDTASTNVAMGIIDDIGYYFEEEPIDAILGLNPTSPESNKVNLVSQLVGGLDKPIMSWWQNETRYHEGNAQLTLGGEDTDNCQSNYVYVPQIWSRYGYSDFRVHLASASIDGMPNYVKGMNFTLRVWYGHGRLYCNDDFFYTLTNASNAVWNETLYDWEVDCDVTKAKNVILNIGSDGNTTDSNTKQLILTGADYIEYLPWADTCVVYANHYRRLTFVQMNYRFLNNHCLAHNAKEQSVGFADAKVIDTQRRIPSTPSTAPPPTEAPSTRTPAKVKH